MKVLRWVPSAAAVIGICLRVVVAVPASSAGLEAGDGHGDDDPRPLRGSGGSAAALAPPFEEGAGEEEGGGRDDGGDRLLTEGCASFPCATPAPLHFCFEGQFLLDRCERAHNLRMFPGVSSLCHYAEPFAVVLSGLELCSRFVRSVTFEMFQDGRRIRRFAEKQWPYTVFGDTASPLTVNSRTLDLDSTYTLTVTIRDLAGCVVDVRTYEFTFLLCD